MTTFRFSIAGLLAVIGTLGVAFAALRSPSYLWANVTFSAALAALVLAAINVAIGRGRSRAFWAGFLIAGGSYFAACSARPPRVGLPPARDRGPIRLPLCPDSTTTARASGGSYGWNGRWGDDA